MSFLGNLFGKKHDDFEDEPITGYDPLHSEQKVNDYLGTAQPDHLATEQQINNPLMPTAVEDGLPPDPTGATDSFATNNNVAQMPSGATAQQMANKYINQQKVTPKTVGANNSAGGPSEEIINLKLDSMKNQLDAINQRIQKIEHLLTNKRW